MRNIWLGIVVALLAAGCSTDKVHELMRHNPAPVTNFLPNKERLVRQPDTFPVHYLWANTNAMIRAGFTNIYFAPFDVSNLRKGNAYDEMRDKAIGKQLGLDHAIVELGEYGRNVFIKTFKDREKDTRLRVVDNPKLPHTAIFEFAITGFVPTRAEVSVAGMAGNFLLPGVGIVADFLSAGSIAIECRVRDSQTRSVVAMFADTEGEPQALLQFAKFTYTSAAKINLKRIAEYCAECCVVDDVSKIRRDFPLSFIVLPSDLTPEKDEKKRK